MWWEHLRPTLLINRKYTIQVLLTIFSKHTVDQLQIDLMCFKLFLDSFSNSIKMLLKFILIFNQTNYAYMCPKMEGTFEIRIMIDFFFQQLLLNIIALAFQIKNKCFFDLLFWRKRKEKISLSLKKMKSFVCFQTLYFFWYHIHKPASKSQVKLRRKKKCFISHNH